MNVVTIRARSLRIVHRRTRAGQRLVDLEGLAQEAGLRADLIRAFLAQGLIEPSGGTAQAPLFARGDAARVACAARLHYDLGLNVAGSVLACELLERIGELEERLARYERGA
jgi:hypothetical protein